MIELAGYWSGCARSGRKVIVGFGGGLVRRLHVDLCRLATCTCRRG
ncbi:putative leader peptide [Actinomycetospora sp. NBC_00405]